MPHIQDMIYNRYRVNNDRLLHAGAVYVYVDRDRAIASSGSVTYGFTTAAGSEVLTRGPQVTTIGSREGRVEFFLGGVTSGGVAMPGTPLHTADPRPAPFTTAQAGVTIDTPGSLIGTATFSEGEEFVIPALIWAASSPFYLTLTNLGNQSQDFSLEMIAAKTQGSA